MVLTVALLLLSLLPAQALGQEGDGGVPSLQSPYGDGFDPAPVSTEPPQGPADVPDVGRLLPRTSPRSKTGVTEAIIHQEEMECKKQRALEKMVRTSVHK